MSTIIEFKDVNKEYKSGDHILKAMDNVNFTIDEGEFVAQNIIEDLHRQHQKEIFDAM